ncbi:uncharacterized protein BDR25DRAFT_374512 [Lindgomyces ingoldianus]|uniref:Uncharacterized protein n=1 Tax=Lindgomyces ingoldianus TaxID=673940 RepID=A0ACB6QKZ5_9PLEO|nr:uncharacterized protein BDR25DRAFT_374512 [Lindgomyces ingoldianus]KAF2467684.1 hypothetical protein BDR25DRAFT_374512 [Lindgomyces ingoldianus]
MDRSRITPGSLSTTPQKHKRGGLEDLLAKFGSRSSATSVTKARKLSAVVPNQHTPTPTVTEGRSKREFTPDTPYLTTAPTPKMGSLLSVPALSDTSAKKLCSPSSPQSSGDELAKTPIIATRPATRIRTLPPNELKMERRKWGRDEQPRRSSRRQRAGTILQSDTVNDDEDDELQYKEIKPKAPLRMKLDTARNRLRDDIALQSKAKANNFFIANKRFFLPLLPQNNYISKLASKSGVDASIVEYKELTEQPKGVTATMKPYQLAGLSFLVHLYNNGFSGILGDEMGLGKTLQTLSLFQYLEEQDKKSRVSSEELRPYLVVCPLSVLNSWVNEAQKWVPGLKVLRMHGTVKERNRLKRVALGAEDMYRHETSHSKNRRASRKAGRGVAKPKNPGAKSYKIIVTTYEVFQAEASWFRQAFIWRYAVLDEGHKIKNSVTQISTALKGVSAEYRLILTGTPLQNNLVEMWALLAWLYPDVFTASTEILFKESFDLTRGKVNQQTMDDARHLLELIMLRRMKNSPGVNLGLPPKEEVLLYVPLTPMQRFWYTRLLTRVGDAILDELFTNIQRKEQDAIRKEKHEDELWNKMEELEKQAESGEKLREWEETVAIMKQALVQEQSDTSNRGAWQKLMNLIMQLRKCCSHPYLLPNAAPEPYYLGDHVIRASGKFILLEKLLRDTIFNKGKKVLIFSGFVRTLDCCEDLLALIGERGKVFKYLRLDGSTARARRNLDIRMFNNSDSEYKVMLLSTRAGGLGINLTSAEDVIFLDEDWNPQITLQAEARAHRIGQTKKVTIYKLCTQGTVEEQMMGRIRKKLYLSAKITESMRSIHGEQTSTKGKGRMANGDDLPQMDTTQLKSLVRRGAQTLSHPEIDATEMLSWDLETMLQKCRDKPSDPQANPEASASELDEEKWLSAMERVECAIFDGKRYQYECNDYFGTSSANILPTEITREDRRKGKNTTVMIDGFAINKESLNCNNWEAVPIFAGKDPRLADVKREKRPKIVHEKHCLICYEEPNGKNDELIPCKGCPRSYHHDCLEKDFQTKVQSWNGFYCPQHECLDCGKKTSDAGGLIYRCRWCKDGYCEDCLDCGKEELIGENLPEFEMLGEGPSSQGFYIKCPNCVEYAQTDRKGREWMESMEQSYQEQYEEHVKQREEEHRAYEKEQDEREKKKEEQAKVGMNLPPQQERLQPAQYSWQNGRFSPIADDDVDSPPAMTDTSFLTPAPGESGVSTPMFPQSSTNVSSLIPSAMNLDASKKRPLGENADMAAGASFGPAKRMKMYGGGDVGDVEKKIWNIEDDPLLAAFGDEGSLS